VGADVFDRRYRCSEWRHAPKRLQCIDKPEGFFPKLDLAPWKIPHEKDFILWHSAIRSIPEKRLLYACDSRPLKRRFGFAIPRKPSIGAPIIRLLAIRCPTAVIFTVVTVIIFPLQSHTMTPRRHHVGVKFVLGGSPRLIDGNSTPSIMRIIRVGFAMTTPFHCAINIVKRVFLKAGVNTSRGVAPPAFCRFTADQRSALHKHLCAAGAFAAPSFDQLAAGIGVNLGWAKNQPAPEYLPS
jgi:hypothetical protein